MTPIHTLDQDSLFDALTEYYQKYRGILESNWNDQEFLSCRDTLLAILEELNKRKGYKFGADELPRDFKFERGSTAS
jgi:hypothetical protein